MFPQRKIARKGLIVIWFSEHHQGLGIYGQIPLAYQQLLLESYTGHNIGKHFTIFGIPVAHVGACLETVKVMIDIPGPMFKST